ncbi:hypothetical protein CFP56_001533, partial [Quercus suber]
GGLSRANGKCLSSLVDILGLLTQVFRSLVNGQFSIIGSSCCKAISEIEGNCLSNLFPSNPIFALLLNNSCGQPSKGNKQVSIITASKAALPRILLGNQDILECWSSFSSVPGCLTDVMNSLFNGRVIFFGPDCHKAITLVNDQCLPKLFSLNPAFHSTLKNTRIGKKMLQNAGHHFQALIGVLMRFLEHFPEVNLVWSILLVANPSLLLVTSVGPRCSHSTHSSLRCSRVNVNTILGLHQNLEEFDHAYEFK